MRPIVQLLTILIAAALAARSAHAAVAGDILGTWTTAFISDGSGNESQRQTMTFNADGTCDMKVDAFLNFGLGQTTVRMDMPCRYHLGSPSATVTGAYEIDYVMVSQLMTYTDQSSVDSQNQDHYCGYTDWQVGVAKDITGRDCDGSTFAADTPSPDLIKVDGQGQLSVGLVPSDDAAAQTARPTSLDPCFVYYRPGHVPPGGGGSACNRTPPDPLPGTYQVTSHLENTQGCGTTGSAAGGGGYAIVYANTSVIAGTSGWSLESCDSLAACQTLPRPLQLFTPWPIGDQTSPSTWTGRVENTWMVGQCQANVTLATIERHDDGTLKLVHYTWHGTLPQAATEDACEAQAKQIDPAAAGFACQSAGELDLAPAH